MADISADPMPPGLAKAWDGGVGATRGPRPSASLDAILDLAIELGDTSGVTGMSLGKIGQRLQLTPNALYRYVSSRDELHALAWERALGSPPELTGSGWREGLTLWSDALLDRYAAHPWLLDLAVRLPIGPGALTWLEALLAAVEPLPLDHRTRLKVATLVDGYVRSSALLARDLSRSTTTLDPAVGEFLRPRIADRGLARVADVFAEGAFAPSESSVEDDYRFGLACLLDGIEAQLAR